MPFPWVVSELTALGASDSLGCLPVERVHGTPRGPCVGLGPGLPDPLSAPAGCCQTKEILVCSQ